MIMLQNVTFDCRAAQRAGLLEVTYTIENGGGVDLGVFNHLQGIATDGGLDFSPDAVFRDVEDDTLLLMKMALPVPPRLQITAYVPPHASLVPAGKSLAETFTVPVPVKVRQPFKRALLSGEVIPSKPVTARHLEVRIGVFPCGPDVRLVAEHPAWPEVLTVQTPGPALGGQEVLSARFALTPDVDALDYVAFPWR
jgi:hypothetical protein